MSDNREEYRISLDIYNGPLDLLLYLVYKSEVDVFNIPIADIVEQYLSYVEAIKALDIEIAGDFMVMAGRLINIKSKMLMPRPQAEPEEEEIIDPRAELVKELLEYKEYKERAYALGLKRHERDDMFERTPPKEKAETEREESDELLDEDVSVWDLLSAFHRVTKDFMPEVGRKIVYDDTPVSVYVEKLLGRLAGAPGGKLAFRALFDGLRQRMQVIGVFLAVLEAAKEGALKLHQVPDRSEILLEFVPEEKREKHAEPDTQTQE